MRFENGFSFWRAFTSNGWQHMFDPDSMEKDYRTYTLIVNSAYDCKVYARVCESQEHLQLSGQYGVQWIDVEYDEDIELPFDWSNLDELRDAICMAENNLTLIGVPFAKDYDFHGDNKLEMYNRNKDTRLKFGIDAKEAYDNDERHKKIMAEIEERKRKKAEQEDVDKNQ